MDDDLRQHKTWNTFTQGLGEFIVAYSWADKAITFLLLSLVGGDPNRGMVSINRMDARAKCEKIKIIGRGTSDPDVIVGFAAAHDALTGYRNNLLHSCLEWHPTKHRFSLSNFGQELVPSITRYVQPKQIRELKEKAKEAEALSNRVMGYLARHGLLSALDPRTRRPIPII